MYDTHYFTIHKTCPCQIENEAVRKTKEIFNKSSCLTDFVAEMQNQQIIGRLISYDKETNTIFIHKRYACRCGAAILKTKHGLVNGAIAATTITQPLIAQSTIASAARNSFDLYSLRYLARIF